MTSTTPMISLPLPDDVLFRRMYYCQGIAACIVALVTRAKSNSWCTTVEHLFLAVLFFQGINITYCEMQILKTTITWLFFWVDAMMLETDGRLGSVISLETADQGHLEVIVMDDKNKPSAVQNEGHNGDTNDDDYEDPRLIQIQHCFLDAMDCFIYVYAPCLGYGILSPSNRGTAYHNYKTIAKHCLARHKFLTFSVVALFRPLNLIILFMAVTNHGILYNFCCIIFEKQNNAGLYIFEFSLLLHVSFMIVNMLMDTFVMLATIMEIDDRTIEDSKRRPGSSDLFHRYPVLDKLKTGLLLIATMVWVHVVPRYVHFFSFYLYLLHGFVIGFLIHVVLLSLTGLDVSSPPAAHEESNSSEESGARIEEPTSEEDKKRV